MDLLFKIRDFIKHLDVHLSALAGNNLALFYGAIFLVVFCETGLVVTPFLPGDSLLFALGSIAGADATTLSLPLMIVLLVATAVLGDAVNYAIGYRLGPKVFKSEGSWLFNKKHLLRAQAFYEKYGSKTIILARFVPIVRTFAPFVAGIGKMRYSQFVLYNVIGAVAWVLTCVMAGYFFRQRRVGYKTTSRLVLVAIVAISDVADGGSSSRLQALRRQRRIRSD